MKHIQTITNLSLMLAGILILSGCRGLPTASEREERRNFKTVGNAYRPEGRRPDLPELSPTAPFSNFVAYALLNQPRVEAAYYDWASSVERITIERSLPDPQITFQSDIADTVMTIMPGLMQTFPGPGKLSSRANVAAAQSQASYFEFESAVLQSAFDLKRAFYQLHFLDERLRINRKNLALLNNLERIARAQNEVGKTSLQDVLGAQISHDRVVTEIINLEDLRRPLMAAFKAALGLSARDADPPVPLQWETTELNLDDEAILDIAFQRNPRLQKMEAMVRATRAEIAMAYKENMPDFSLGLMADAKAAPTMFRPLAGVTLPIWRDKVAAEIARAKADKLAAMARWNGEQIMLTTTFAEKSFAYRELTRNLALFQDRLIPKARQSVEVARAGYLAGTIDFFNLIDAERMQLDFELSEVEARTQREIVLAELSLMIAGVQPPGAPVLPSSDATVATTFNSTEK